MGMTPRPSSSDAVLASPPHRTQTADWASLCAQHQVPLIVDSAAGFGSLSSDGREHGARGDAEVFSFHATKPFAIGEGGLIITANPDLNQRMGEMINFGFGSDRVVRSGAGTNAKLSEIQAATALAVLDRFDAILETRRALAREYRAELSAKGWSLQTNSENAAWQFIPALAPSAREREAARRRCDEAGVEVRTYYEPLHSFPAFATCERTDSLAVTDAIAARVLSLPLANSMASETARYVGRLAAGAEPHPRLPAGESAGSDYRNAR